MLCFAYGLTKGMWELTGKHVFNLHDFHCQFRYQRQQFVPRGTATNMLRTANVIPHQEPVSDRRFNKLSQKNEFKSHQTLSMLTPSQRNYKSLPKATINGWSIKTFANINKEKNNLRSFKGYMGGVNISSNSGKSLMKMSLLTEVEAGY